MRTVIIYTEEFPNNASMNVAERAIKSAQKLNIKAELYKSVYFKNIDAACREHNIKLRYKPIAGTGNTEFSPTGKYKGSAPASRIANGITHYLLYAWAIKNNKPICILEHDAEFISPPPRPISNGVIQISSHIKSQLTPKMLKNCGRAQKMKTHDKEEYNKINMEWENKSGLIRHPLSGTNGTSGYIITPSAAEKMVSYIKSSGVGFADRIRKKHIGEQNLYLQVPQSVVCRHDINSAYLK